MHKLFVGGNSKNVEFALFRIGFVLADDVLQNLIKWYSPDISKRLKFLKLLRYLEKMFQLETCTYFSSIEIKVVQVKKEQPQHRGARLEGKQQGQLFHTWKEKVQQSSCSDGV